MRDQPSRSVDPYATLGLEPGATMTEVKRAYRRLAKAYHPDSAGEAALPRFLSIHEAYEAIRTGRPMGRTRGTAPAPAAPSEPWRADPERARAARERARRGAAGMGSAGMGGAPNRSAGSARATGSSGPSAGSRSSAGAAGAGGAGAAGAGAAGTGATGSTGTAGRSGTTGGARSGRRRNVRKATMGSTSYDDARDPNDATWSGASWYGPSTGEYWIVNPREYADPRKHGPEYQSRARRPLGATDTVDVGGSSDGLDPGPDDRPGAEAAAAEPVAGPASAADPMTAAGAAAPRTAADAAPTPGAEATWTFDSSTAGAGRRRRAMEDRPRRGQWTAPEARRGEAAEPAAGWTAAWAADARTIRRPRPGGFPGGSPRDWIGAPADDPIRRLGLALVAWPPIGLAAATIIGDVTGCSLYAATCSGTEPLLPWLAQAAILGLLLLLAPVARVLAGGSIGVLFALVPVTAFLVAVGASGAAQAGFALTFFLALAWVVGVAWATWQQVRPRRSGAKPAT